MIYNWFPWKQLIRWLARRHGFLEPFGFLSQFSRISQPSEVAVPLELLRAGVVFHARGLINTRVIQQNLDWVWPFWAERQFDPHDKAFLPRAFAITHVNLTHRNWTAIGVPDCEALPVVDPCGLVTALYDGWSVEGWLLTGDGRELMPSRAQVVTQRVNLHPEGHSIETAYSNDGISITSTATVVRHLDQVTCELRFQPFADTPAQFAFLVRPYNPEGVSFINFVERSEAGDAISVNKKPAIQLLQTPDRFVVSDYREGDVHFNLLHRPSAQSARCEVGLATAAAVYEIQPGAQREFGFSIPIDDATPSAGQFEPWPVALESAARLSLPDTQQQFLYDMAVRTLILHAPGEVFPGPYTYKRFWFRDAAFILHALLCLGLERRVEKAIGTFPARQTITGYFCSQDGEWDSNGEVLWLLERICAVTGKPLSDSWRPAVQKASRWIIRKRVHSPGAPHDGLFPAGFSAEHLGNNDYYYWDDFWGVAGLRAAAALLDNRTDVDLAAEFIREADDFMHAIERSLRATTIARSGVPASPYRRMDAGAIGSIVVDYPLQLWAPGDPRVMNTIEFLLEHCQVHGAFFQEMIHSGVNAYLTLHMAQVLMRAGDPRSADLFRAVAGLASPTGQWPEAIHPHTLGGCMGDGQHVWAAAEWAMMIRNAFVREEKDSLIIGAGVVPEWIEDGTPISFGPTPTPWGPLEIRLVRDGQETVVDWKADWRSVPRSIEVRVPGWTGVTAPNGADRVTLGRNAQHRMHLESRLFQRSTTA